MANLWNAKFRGVFVLCENNRRLNFFKDDINIDKLINTSSHSILTESLIHNYCAVSLLVHLLNKWLQWKCIVTRTLHCVCEAMTSQLFEWLIRFHPSDKHFDRSEKSRSQTEAKPKCWLRIATPCFRFTPRSRVIHHSCSEWFVTRHFWSLHSFVVVVVNCLFRVFVSASPLKLRILHQQEANYCSTSMNGIDAATRGQGGEPAPPYSGILVTPLITDAVLSIFL